MNRNNNAVNNAAIFRPAMILLVVLLFLFGTIFFASGNTSLPRELKLSKVVYEKSQIHTFGPGGINQAFYVYEVQRKLADRIAIDGLDYLESLRSSKHAKNKKKRILKKKEQNDFIHPYWVGYSDWRPTPILKEQQWLRFGRELYPGWQPKLITFYSPFGNDTTKLDFISTIAPEFSSSFHKASSEQGNYYAYGGYRGKCLLVIVPSQKNAYYLYRD